MTEATGAITAGQLARQWLTKRGHSVERGGAAPCPECGHAPLTEDDVRSLAALIDRIRAEADERAAPSTHVRIATVQRATQVETVDVANKLATRISKTFGRPVFWLVDKDCKGLGERNEMGADGPVHLTCSSAFEMDASEIREMRQFAARFLAQEG
jgi:hypothetical protein